MVVRRRNIDPSFLDPHPVGRGDRRQRTLSIQYRFQHPWGAGRSVQHDADRGGEVARQPGSDHAQRLDSA